MSCDILLCRLLYQHAHRPQSITIHTLLCQVLHKSVTVSTSKKDKEVLHLGDWSFERRHSSFRKLGVKDKTPPADQEDVLYGLELYASAGGLSFVESAQKQGAMKRIEMKWAVEWMAEEAATYRMNHPDAMVFHLDAEDFLRLVRYWVALLDSAGKNGDKAWKQGEAFGAVVVARLLLLSAREQLASDGC